MLYLVTYDVPSTDNTSRDKIAHALAAAGLVRVQYSVFWGFMSRNQAESIALKVQQILGTVEGDVRVVPICQKCRARLLQVTVTVGGGKAAIARGTATINTKFLSRAAKSLLGKGAPAIPTPISPNALMPSQDPAIAAGNLGQDPAIPTSDNFDIDVLTAKKASSPVINVNTGDSSSLNSPQKIQTPSSFSQVGITSPPVGSKKIADTASGPKKPFLLI